MADNAHSLSNAEIADRLASLAQLLSAKGRIRTKSSHTKEPQPKFERCRKHRGACPRRDGFDMLRGYRRGDQRRDPGNRQDRTVPYFPITNPDNIREGVLSHEKYREVRNSLPAYARLSFVIAYHTGARKGEIKKIRR